MQKTENVVFDSSGSGKGVTGITCRRQTTSGTPPMHEHMNSSSVGTVKCGRLQERDVKESIETRHTSAKF